MKIKERVYLPERPAEFGPSSAPLAPANSFWDLICQADDAGVRLEVVRGVPTWEAQPGFRHQMTVDRIRNSIVRASPSRPECDCRHVADVVTRFPDGSIKRPDIAIYCREPETLDGNTIVSVPEAVIEVISTGYEIKDLEIGPEFYLSQGVKDVLIFDPVSGDITHVRKDHISRHKTPSTLILECGCSCTV
jgi:Uma2 family endonuclease